MTASRKIATAKGKVRSSLQPGLWPKDDHNAWNAACQPASRLNRGGRAGHLKTVTRESHAERYGYFLGFLDRRGLLQPGAPAAANVTPENVDLYLAELKRRLAPMTIHGSICQLRRVAQYIAPTHDFSWLAEIDKDLAAVAHPRSKFDRLVLTEVLVEAGLTLIREAEDSQKMTKLARACQVRNGLMVTLLALCPVRRRNFATLEIGRSFVEIKGKWWIVLSASQTKEKRADERPIDELLTPVIGRYLSQHRPVLARSDNPPSALWLSAKDGAPITDKEVARVIRTTTLSTVGGRGAKQVRAHRYASSIAIHGSPHLASALLHHTHPSVTNAHYNRATSLSAAESFRQIVRRYEKHDWCPADALRSSSR